MAYNLDSTTSHFPFTAVVGQHQFKLALLLNAVDPKIGGVLVSGPRGSAKSTLARGLSDLVDDHTPFVNLPLGCSEEKLIGTLDLAHALSDKNVRFSPGLLAKAHGGILYVDEVNLLPDPLVDQLLDVSASGVNQIERDGISKQHDARFILIGTMNPEEGELRPQLLDRFGLMVTLDEVPNQEDRVEIVNRRLEFDLDSAAFKARFSEQQLQIKNELDLARGRLRNVTISKAMQLEIASRCYHANVEGVRADLTLRRTAIAFAAWQQTSEVSADQIETVAELVLGHRARPRPAPPENRGNAPKHGTPDSFKQNPTSPSRWTGNATGPSASKNTGDWGALPFKVSKCATPNEIDSNRAPVIPIQPRRQKTEEKMRQGQNEFDKKVKPDWPKTLVSLNQQDQVSLPPRTHLQRVVWKKINRAKEVLVTVLLDSSGSTSNSKSLHHAKQVIRNLVKRCYLKRQRLVFIEFGNDQIVTHWNGRRAPASIDAVLDSVTATGGTPLNQALAHAQRVIQRYQKQSPNLLSLMYLFTDGRTLNPPTSQQVDAEVLVVDTEMGSVQLKRSQRIARSLSGRYCHLSEFIDTTEPAVLKNSPSNNRFGSLSR
ncbi:MAG: AAA family ATPase [Pseudomonadales bacterium]|nr:AAA family ATPase [Pseudomonadales bacterium]